MSETEQSKHEIAAAAQDAIKVIAAAAAEAAKVNSVQANSDHDLILEVKTIQNVMLGEIREIKTGTAQQISDLQKNKLDCGDSYASIYKKDIDSRMDNLDARSWWIIAFLITSLLGVVYNLLK